MSIDRESLKIWDRLVTTIERATTFNPTLKRNLGQETIKFVKDRTQRGLGVVKKKLKPFKKLTKGTISGRRSLRKSGKLSSRTTPETSNMTETGELTNSLDLKVTTEGVEVFIKGKANEDKARYNDDRVLMDVTKEEEQALTNMVAKEIVKALKKF